MAGLLRAATQVTKSFFSNPVSIDNWTFQLFYRATTSIAVFFSIITTAKQFFGNPITCDAGHIHGGIRNEVLESYCWMYANFKIPPEYKGPCAGQEQEAMDGFILYNSYYQWIPVYLNALAIVFYMPRCLWLNMEGGLMKFFGKGTTSRMIEDPAEKRDKLVEFFRSNIHNKYNIYYYGFIFCELLNVIVVIGCFFVTDWFLHHRFLTYGFNVYTYNHLPAEEQQAIGIHNPMCYTFPRIASCTYYRYGSAGKQESVSAICILSLNIINDKVFLVFWWWFFFLFCAGIGRIIFRIVQMNSMKLRFFMIRIRMHRYFKGKVTSKTLMKYINSCSRGDWFVLYQLSKNLNRPFFVDFLEKLSCEVEEAIKKGVDENDDGGDSIVDMLLQPPIYEGNDEKENKKDKDECDDNDN